MTLLEQILENGCKYLSLCEAKLEGNLKLTKDYPLNYLDLCTCKCEIGDLNNLVASYDSLEKLSLCFLTIDSEIVKNISLLNGQSLQVLDLYYVKGTVYILAHSRFGHYFCSNLYGRAPRGPRSVKKSDFFYK